MEGWDAQESGIQTIPAAPGTDAADQPGW
jgi:hypothetical protein